MNNSQLQVCREAAPLRVFIVEDSREVRERLEVMINAIDGARCIGTATTADAAIRGIRECQPNAVVLDLSLQHGSGLDVLRAFPGSAGHMPIYVLSNFSTEPYRRVALRLGGAAFFDKTTEIESMRDMLKQRAMMPATSN